MGSQKSPWLLSSAQERVFCESLVTLPPPLQDTVELGIVEALLWGHIKKRCPKERSQVCVVDG